MLTPSLAMDYYPYHCYYPHHYCQDFGHGHSAYVYPDSNCSWYALSPSVEFDPGEPMVS